MTVEIICADAREALAAMPETSVDAIVTDPPYGLEFMGKEWDRFTGGAVGGYANRLTPSWHSGSWQNKRCLKCGHIASGGSPCLCANPDWVVEIGKTNASALAQQAFHHAWAIEALQGALNGTAPDEFEALDLGIEEI
ncbi:hypothetical protein LCGC14_2595210 [marine sediment metagenome]|uniref:DNA methylase N-4/N-6 domain-containing protein n=1 Tax=marine sediment metagenome TaxID=412755 RepID=A0A0F9CLF4_9ZZZZ